MINTRDFIVFSIHHLNILFYLILLGIFLLLYAKNTSQKNEMIIRKLLAITIPALYIAECLFAVFLGYYTFYEFFPMHLCSLMVILCPVALLTKNQRIFEITYLYGLFGAVMALVFPALVKDNYYDLRIAFFMFKHGLLAIAPIYMVVVNKMKPSFKGMIKSFVIVVLFLSLIVYPLNLIADYNYVYLMSGPANTPLQAIENALGYRGYLFVMGIFSIIIPIVFYLPFIRKSKIKT